MAGTSDKVDGATRRELDEIDFQIIEIKRLNPRATIRQIAKATGLKKSAIATRIRKLPEREAVVMSRAMFRALLPQVYKNYLRRLKENDKQAARDIAFGTGVLTHQQRIETKEIPVTEDDVVRAMRGMDVGTIDRVIKRLESEEAESDPGSDS